MVWEGSVRKNTIGFGRALLCGRAVALEHFNGLEEYFFGDDFDMLEVV